MYIISLVVYNTVGYLFPYKTVFRFNSVTFIFLIYKAGFKPLYTLMYIKYQSQFYIMYITNRNNMINNSVFDVTNLAALELG